VTTPAAAVSSARPGSLLALYRLLLRTQITVPRLLGIAALGALSIVLGLFARLDDNSPQATVDAVASYGLGLLVPLATLWLGTSAVGDLVEDRLLVYLWLKPVPRWQLPAAAVLATVSVVVPLSVLPLTASALVGAADVAWATLLAASLAALAYAGLFVAAGLWFRRAIWWGLAFVVIWDASRCSAGRPPHSAWRPASTSSSRRVPPPRRSSSFPRLRWQGGWPRPGAIAAPISTSF
jgi:ABC-2 type transport system permease protein